MNFTTKLRKAAANASSRIISRENKEKREEEEFYNWAKEIFSEVGNVTFSIKGVKYHTEVVYQGVNVGVILTKNVVRWKDIKHTGRCAGQWYIILAELKMAGLGLWSVHIRGIGNFHHFSDLPEGKRDCYCRPDNRTQRIPEIKRLVEHTLIHWVDPRSSFLKEA